MIRRLFFTFLNLLITTSLFAQTPSLGERPGGYTSIHQQELEQNRDYKPSKKMPEFQGAPMNLQPRLHAPDKEIFGYLPYWTYVNYPNLNYDLLTTIAYFGAEINEFGNITNLHDWPAAGLINKAHSEGVRVVLTAILFNPNQLSSLLSDPNRRTTLVNNLLSQVQAANADGVNIDFEGVPSGNKQNLTVFLTELTEAFHSAIPGSFVTIFTPAVDWSDVYDYFTLAQIADGLVVQGYDYHWSTAPTAGPIAPLTGNRWGFANVSWTISDYLTKTFSNSSKLILSVPFYGFEWTTASDALEAATLGVGQSLFYSEAFPNANQYGRIWDQESQTPWYKYNDGQWHQGWYDDSLSLATKFEFAKSLDLKGIGIWALSYDGERLELQGALSDAFGSTAAPLQPAAFRLVNLGAGRVEIAGQPASGATSYRIYDSLDGVTFGNGVDFPNATITLNALSPDTTYYFKMSAVNGNGESNVTEVLAVRPATAQADILIVNGFDRVSGTVNTFDFVKRFAPSVAKTGDAFDSCSNEAIQNNAVLLTDYKYAIWISGEEGTATESFSQVEQSRIAQYLESGGNLFVSGSEIGYDLVERGNAADQAFYRDYLRAQYVRDQVAGYAVTGVSATIFAGLGATFDNGSHGTYNVDFPDGIRPLSGAVLNLSYNGYNPGSFGGAGIQYAGTFRSGTIPGRLVYLAFPFETIYPESSRDAVMAAVLDFFNAPVTGIADTESSVPEAFSLEQNYPNPFNPSTTIVFRLTNETPLRTRLEILNMRGQEIRTLVDKNMVAGEYGVEWDALDAGNTQMASGVYLYRLRVGDREIVRKMMLVR